MPERKFYVCGQTVAVSADYDAYNSLRMMFSKAAAKSAEEFAGLYTSYGNIDNVVNNAFDDGMSIIGGVIDRLVVKGILISQKIYDIDANRFFQDFYRDDYFCWEEAFDSVQDQYMAIKLEQEQLDEYRTQRRKNRSRWVGGGFGIGGAIKGAAKAGAMNMASGALHGLFNAGAKVLSMADESLQKSSLYKSDDTKSTLIGAIYTSVFGIHLAVWDMTEQRNGKMRVECLEPGAGDKAAAIVNNFSGMSKNEIRNMIPRVMLMNPYNENLYRELFSIFGDADGGLQKVARYFGADVSFITEEKEALAGKIFEGIKEQLGMTEQAALSAKRDYESALELHGLGDTLSAQENLKVIEGALRDYDTKARTVDGKIFRTRDEADEAIKSEEEFKRAVEACDYKSSEENARKAMEIVMSYKAKTDAARKRAESKRDEIGKILVDFETEARTVKTPVGGIIFDTREEAVSAREEAAKINKLIGLSYKKSEEDAKKALERLKGYTPGVRRVYGVYVDKVKEILSSFDTEASTVNFNGVSVVLDREEAEKVKAGSELNKLAVSWEKYKADRTNVSLGYIAGLIRKMPTKIRESFWSLLNDFETEQRKEAGESIITLQWPLVFMVYAAAVAVLMFSAHGWQDWEWAGMKGVALACMIALPAALLQIYGNHEANVRVLVMSAWCYWSFAFIVLAPLLNLGDVMTGLLGLFSLVMIPVSIVAIIKMLRKSRRAGKHLKYLSDFEVLSSQSEEYRAYKASHSQTE